MNLLEALQFCMEGTSVKAKHWKHGKVIFTVDEANVWFHNKRFYFMWDENARLTPINLTDPEDIFDEWEVVEE